MKLILLTLILGPFGSYRFYKKEYKLGVIYLFTGGLLGFGYIYDLYLSFYEYFISKNTTNETNNDTSQEVIKKQKNNAIIATILCLSIIFTICIILPTTSEDYDDSSTSSSDSWGESYSTCKSCGKKVQRKYLYSSFCGKCYSKWSNAS